MQILRPVPFLGPISWSVSPPIASPSHSSGSAGILSMPRWVWDSPVLFWKLSKLDFIGVDDEFLQFSSRPGSTDSNQPLIITRISHVTSLDMFGCLTVRSGGMITSPDSPSLAHGRQRMPRALALSILVQCSTQNWVKSLQTSGYWLNLKPLHNEKALARFVLKYGAAAHRMKTFPATFECTLRLEIYWL